MIERSVEVDVAQDVMAPKPFSNLPALDSHRLGERLGLGAARGTSETGSERSGSGRGGSVVLYMLGGTPRERLARSASAAAASSIARCWARRTRLASCFFFSAETRLSSFFGHNVHPGAGLVCSVLVPFAQAQTQTATAKASMSLGFITDTASQGISPQRYGKSQDEVTHREWQIALQRAVGRRIHLLCRVGEFGKPNDREER